MKELTILVSLFIVIMAPTLAQSSKTNLSLQVSAAAAANRAKLKNYVWTRTVQVFISGTLKTTIVSSLSIGPDGKIVTTAVSSVATDPPPTKGIRGDIARKKIGEMKTYVDSAVKVSMSYLYMNKGNTVNYFDAANITQAGNTITVTGNSVNRPGDHFTTTLTAGTLAYINQSFSSVSSGDAVSGTFNYQTFGNGLTAFANGELDLPAKNMKLMISNTNYAQKLQ